MRTSVKTINAPLEAAGRAGLAAYDRDQEGEADRLGMALAARAGYDPAALGRALENTERMTQWLTDAPDEGGFFDRHPTTAARVTTTERLAADIDWQPAQPFAISRQDFVARFDGLTWGPENPLQGILRDNRFMHPDLNLTILFPPDWRAVNTPLFVGAFAPDNVSLVVLSGTRPPAPAQVIAERFIDQVRAQTGLEPAESRALAFDIGPAWLVRFEDTGGQKPTSIFYLWINADEATYRVIGIGDAGDRERLRESVMSLRRLTDEEQSTIVVRRIRFAVTEAGESLESFGRRVDNRFTPEMTAIVNGLPESAPLTGDRLIKILRVEPFAR